MASNNYTSANVVPAADTFREWVDLTNRITYDMEKVVVTVAANTQGARTSGNAKSPLVLLLFFGTKYTDFVTHHFYKNRCNPPH